MRKILERNLFFSLRSFGVPRRISFLFWSFLAVCVGFGSEANGCTYAVPCAFMTVCHFATDGVHSCGHLLALAQALYSLNTLSLYAASCSGGLQIAKLIRNAGRLSNIDIRSNSFESDLKFCLAITRTKNQTNVTIQVDWSSVRSTIDAERDRLAERYRALDEKEQNRIARANFVQPDLEADPWAKTSPDHIYVRRNFNHTAQANADLERMTE
jgi:hypothetical protein